VYVLIGAKRNGVEIRRLWTENDLLAHALFLFFFFLVPYSVTPRHGSPAPTRAASGMAKLVPVQCMPSSWRRVHGGGRLAGASKCRVVHSPLCVFYPTMWTTEPIWIPGRPMVYGRCGPVSPLVNVCGVHRAGLAAPQGLGLVRGVAGRRHDPRAGGRAALADVPFCRVASVHLGVSSRLVRLQEGLPPRPWRGCYGVGGVQVRSAAIPHCFVHPLLVAGHEVTDAPLALVRQLRRRPVLAHVLLRWGSVVHDVHSRYSPFGPLALEGAPRAPGTLRRIACLRLRWLCTAPTTTRLFPAVPSPDSRPT